MHALVRDAADGSAAISRFIATRFDLADRIEAEGSKTTADEVRAVWTGVLESLSTVDRALSAESYEAPVVAVA